ncbi:MAG: LysE type translocator [Pseudomonadota bacterium]|jgi:threonine/homoserine/homoserine lactone efflux protein
MTVTLVPFLIAALVLAITPGPGMAYVVARTAAGGRAEGLASCLGTGLGGMVHVVASALGLSLLLAQSALVFTWVKYLGAAYLVYLGLVLLLRKAKPPAGGPLPAQGSRRALIEGVVVEALNIKTALFFVAFLPQFVSSDVPVTLQLLLMGALCVTFNTLADVAAVFAAERLLASDGAGGAGGTGGARARWLRRGSGLTLIGLGAYLAMARRSA